MTLLTPRLAVTLAASSMLCLLCSCAPIPRKVAFDEGAFARFKGSGSGTVTGQAYTVLRDNSMRYASSTDIGLMPDTAYTEEIAATTFDRGRKLTPADPRFTKYVSYGNTDMAGNFTFSHVHPGHYYVFCDLPFKYSDGDGDDVDDDQWIYAQITVKSGQTTQVNDWTQGH